MSDLAYWQKRQVEDMFGYMEKAELTADKIASVYKKASRYLSLKAIDVFEKYQEKYELTEQEARALINTLHDKTSLEELLEKLKNAETQKEKQELIKRLEAPAYRARLERLQQLQDQTDLLMKNVYQQEKDFSTQHYIDLANEAYYKSMYRLQQRAEAAFSFSHLSADQADKVLKSRWSGGNYSKRIWDNTSALAADLKEELLINLITGRTEREVANILANKFAQGASVARRLVRTESNFLSTEMNFKAYEDAGIEEYQFLATLDLKTSKICRSLDGEIFQVKDRKTGVNCPPMHPWCRSTTVSVVNREWLKDVTRSALDPATGKRIKVPRLMNYAEWYDKYVKGKPGVELEEKKMRNRSSDRKQYERYKEILGNNAPANLDSFQEMKYNDGEKFSLLKDYKKSVKNGMISPLSGFDNYVSVYKKINDEIIGIEAKDGIKVTSQSKHFIERVIGTMQDPKTGQPRNGVAIEDIKEALLQGKTRMSMRDPNSVKYVTDKCIVSLNPITGKLIQCNPQ